MPFVGSFETSVRPAISAESRSASVWKLTILTFSPFLAKKPSFCAIHHGAYPIHGSVPIVTLIGLGDAEPDVA